MPKKSDNYGINIPGGLTGSDRRVLKQSRKLDRKAEKRNAEVAKKSGIAPL